jgi:hypothetical protein
VRVFFCAAALAALVGCQDELRLKLRDEACTKNRDCSYGLDCADAPPLPDGGIAVAIKDGGPPAPARTCQYHSFGECEGDGSQPSHDGQPQCLNSYKCLDGHCTVQCAGHKDCKEDEVCKIGLCQKGKNANSRCYDNRDCPYPETCYYGQCVTRTQHQRCSTDLDCAMGSRCINSVCQ